MSKFSVANLWRPLALGVSLAAMIAGCTTPPAKVSPSAPLAAAPPAATAPIAVVPIAAAPALTPAVAPVRTARIKGSEETSTLLDNFTAFVSAIDGQPVVAGRKGWNTPLEIGAGRRLLRVEFNRGIFVAGATLELEAVADASYEVRYATDAQLFGHNSYCDFWIVDTGTGKTVTAIKKAPVNRIQ